MVPEGWTHTVLAKVVEFKNGLNFTKSDQGEAIKIVGVSNFKNYSELRSTENLDVINIAGKVRDGELLADGDLLFVRSNGNKELIGRCLFFPRVTERIAFSGFTIRGRVNKTKLLPEYLSDVARSPIMKQQISRNGGGTNISNLSQQILGDVSIALPPIPEQKKIAQILSAWDQAITATERLFENSQQRKKGLMQQLLTGKKRLPGFEGEWQEAELGKLVSISKGEQLNRSTLSDAGLYPVINGGITPSGYTDRTNCHGNTVTISEGGNSCGFVAFQQVPFWCGGHCYALKKPQSSAFFLYQLLKLHEAEIMRMRVGSGLPNIQKKDLSGLKLVLPACPVEQKAIAQVLAVADQEGRLLVDRLNSLKQEKTALMQQLLTGKRRVKVDWEAA